MSVRRLNSILLLGISILILAGCRTFQSEPSPTAGLTASPETFDQLETEVFAPSQKPEASAIESTASTEKSSFEGLPLSEFSEESFRVSGAAQPGSGADEWPDPVFTGSARPG